jgi:hypothetical protein
MHEPDRDGSDDRPLRRKKTAEWLKPQKIEAVPWKYPDGRGFSDLSEFHQTTDK